MTRSENKFNIAVITLPLNDIANSICAEVNLVNLLQTLEPLANNIFALTGELSAYPGKRVKIIKSKGWQTGEKPLIIKMLNHMLNDLQISFNLLKIFKHVDIVAFFIGARYYVLSTLLSKILGKKVVAFSFTTALRLSQVSARLKWLKRSEVVSPRLANILERFVFALADQIAVESESVIEFSGLEKFRHKISIYGAQYMDLALFKKKKDLKDRGALVGYIGSLEWLKGVTELAQAIPLIVKEEGEVTFLLAGDGALSGRIKATLKAEKALDRVKLVGWIPHDEVANCLNELRLLVLPSHTEGIPGIIQESMACGTPVLATPVGGVPDLIKDGETGFIMEDNSPECIARNVIRVLKYPGIDKITHSARLLIEQQYSYEAMVEKCRVALDGLLKGEK